MRGGKLRRVWSLHRPASTWMYMCVADDRPASSMHAASAVIEVSMLKLLMFWAHGPLRRCSTNGVKTDGWMARLMLSGQQMMIVWSLLGRLNASFLSLAARSSSNRSG